MGNRDGYKLRREEYARQAEDNHRLLNSFFGRETEPLSVVRQRLDAQLRMTEVNKMKAEIDELNKGDDDGHIYSGNTHAGAGSVCTATATQDQNV